MLSAPAGSAYNWSNGTQLQTTTVAQTGIYHATVTDANQCSAVSQSVTVIVNPLPQISFRLNPDSVCNTVGSLLLNATPSGGSFSGTGVNASQFEPGVAGIGTFPITYSYTDNNGCTNSAGSNEVVYLCTDIQNIENGAISVFPNPSAGEFTFETSQGFKPDAIKVFDGMGRLVLDISNQVNNSTQIKLDLKSYAGGIYIAVFSRQNKVVRKKLIKTE